MTHTKNFNIGDAVMASPTYADGDNSWMYYDKVGKYAGWNGVYHAVDFGGGWDWLFTDDEITLAGPLGYDVTGRTIVAGDVIVYFTRKGSHMYSQKAKVESIGARTGNRPHILVLKEDAVQKDLFARKAWLWSFANSVKVN